MNVNIDLTQSVKTVKLRDVAPDSPFIFADSFNDYKRGLISDHNIYIYVKRDPYIINLTKTEVYQRDSLGYMVNWLNDDLDVILVDAEITVHGIK